MAFERAASISEFRDGEPVAVTVDGVDVALARDGEEYYALQDLCSHGHVALSEGEVSDCAIECWLHGSTFDLRTGKPTCLPLNLWPTFPVRVEGDDVWVDVSTTLNGVTPD